MSGLSICSREYSGLRITLFLMASTLLLFQLMIDPGASCLVMVFVVKVSTIAYHPCLCPWPSSSPSSTVIFVIALKIGRFSMYKYACCPSFSYLIGVNMDWSRLVSMVVAETSVSVSESLLLSLFFL